MKKDGHFQDQDHFTSNVNKQLTKSKEPAYDHQITVVETTGKKTIFQFHEKNNINILFFS